MKHFRGKTYLIMIISLVLAMMLMILPLPDWLNWFWPEWVAMVLICWVLIMPERINVGIAWLVGLFLDVLTGTVLGEHAFALVIITYFIAKFNLRIRLFGLLQQAVTVSIAIVFYLLCLFSIRGLTGTGLISWQYWLSSLTSGLLWPWMFMFLREYVMEQE